MKNLFKVSLVVIVILTGYTAFASEVVSAEIAYYTIDNMLLFVSAILVLFMQAGFAGLEAGMSPTSNTVNILFKNFTDLIMGTLLFYLVGYGIMYGDDISGGLGLFAFIKIR